MELTPWKVPLWSLHQGSYLVELTPWKLPHGTYTMYGTSLNVHIGRALMEFTLLKLPHGTYTIEVI